MFHGYVLQLVQNGLVPSVGLKTASIHRGCWKTNTNVPFFASQYYSMIIIIKWPQNSLTSLLIEVFYVLSQNQQLNLYVRFWACRPTNGTSPFQYSILHCIVQHLSMTETLFIDICIVLPCSFLVVQWPVSKLIEFSFLFNTAFTHKPTLLLLFCSSKQQYPQWAKKTK